MKVYGRRSSILFAFASFTRSACRRSEYTGSCHLPVSGCLCGLNGLGLSEGASDVCVVASPGTVFGSSGQVSMGVATKLDGSAG